MTRNRVPQIPLYIKERENSHTHTEDRWIGLKALFLMLVLTLGVIVLFFSFQETNNSEEALLVQQLQNPEPVDSASKQDPLPNQSEPEEQIPLGAITFVDTTISESVPIRLIYDTLSYNHSAIVEILEEPQHGSLNIDSTIPIFLFSEGELFHFYVEYIYTPTSNYVGQDKISFGFLIEHETDSQVLNQTRDVIVRTRISPVFTKTLLNVPAGYTFSELDKAKTRTIKSTFEHLNALKNAIPEKDDWLNRRYNTCAIVGNGGSLRGKGYGEEIDSHEVVIRFNGAPTVGFEKDVGLKMNVGFGSAGKSSVCWKWNTTYFNDSYEVFCQAVALRDYQRFSNCFKRNPEIKYQLISYKFVDLADSIVNFYEGNRSGGKKKYRSTGLMATLAAATVCDHLSIYGFNSSDAGYHHYYDSKKNITEWSGHSYWAERMFYTDLSNGYGGFKDFFYMYELPKSVALKDKD